MLDFVVIKYKNKGIYLGVDETRVSKDLNKSYFKWAKSINEAMWFNCVSEAEKFAKSYFKHFEAYEFITINGATYI